MIKIQDVEINGTKYRVREPRLRDYLASKGRVGEAVMTAFLGGMIVDEEGNAVGEEFIQDLPLSHFGKLSDIVNDILEGSESKDPLEPKSDSSSG